MNRLLPWCPLVFSFVALVGCGESGSGPDPYSTSPETGIRREVFAVGGTHPDANPTTASETPRELDATTVVRYRVDLETPAPADAILIAVPGFLAGASTFDGLARTLVRRGAARGVTVEVWAIDRRSNALEDVHGLEVAERERDPSRAAAYYQNLERVSGRTFEGVVDPDVTTYMSEWGLATHVEDLRRVIALVPESSRRDHVFLLGHSLGGSFVEAYGAWQFESDGVRGFEELAGIVVVDGVLGTTPVTEQAYLDGSASAGFPSPGLTGIRAGSVYTALPVLGVNALITAEIAALHAHFDPDSVLDDVVRDQQFTLLFGYSNEAAVPPLSNLAALGLAFDDDSQPLPFVRASLGAVDGPTEPFSSFFNPTATLSRPSAPGTTYRWVDGPSDDEFSSAADLAAAMVHGRSNLAEWYFPTRLSLDLSAVAGGTIPTTGFPASYGLRAFGGSANDAPVLCIAAELVGDVARCDAIRARIAPAVGTGRPSAGATRGVAGENVPGFGVLDVTTMAHIDPVLARDRPGNPVPGAIESFFDAHRGPGTVVVPVQRSPSR